MRPEIPNEDEIEEAAKDLGYVSSAEFVRNAVQEKLDRTSSDDSEMADAGEVIVAEVAEDVLQTPEADDHPFQFRCPSCGKAYDDDDWGKTATVLAKGSPHAEQVAFCPGCEFLVKL